MRVLAVLLLLCFGPLTAAAQAPALLSHRAVYHLGLARADSASGIVGAQGLLVMEWNNVCDGYAFTQRIRNELHQADNRYTADLIVSSWEARKGDSFRFNSRYVVNDTTVEETRGLSTLGDTKRVAHFEKPEQKAIALSAGTMFPTQYALHLIDRATLGEQFVRVPVFDGSSVDGLKETSAVISRDLPPGSYEGTGAVVLGPLRSWRVRVAYFKHSDLAADSRPEYEVAFRLFENGVSTDVVLDYGGFALKGVLKLLKPLPTYC